jgi:hypothetical protein
MRLTKKQKAQRAFLQATAMRIKQADYKLQQAITAEQRKIDDQNTSYQQFKDAGSKPVITPKFECSAGRIITALSFQ